VVHLRLYVSGRSDLSERAAANARSFCTTELGTGYRLEIVDVIAQPQVAEQDGVVTTPTLVRCSPQPERRLIGDLSDRARVSAALGLGQMVGRPA
jgi:circadian clock protein KaiB